MSPACEFCAIAAGTAPAEIVREWPDTIAIRPRGGGVNDGHILVIPRAHIPDAASDPAIAGLTMTRAAELAATLPAANIITSRGAAATQTVFHLHIHVVPRVLGDGLMLPWTRCATEATGVAEPSDEGRRSLAGGHART